jgi:hypothetical protein
VTERRRRASLPAYTTLPTDARRSRSLPRRCSCSRSTDKCSRRSCRRSDAISPPTLQMLEGTVSAYTLSFSVLLLAAAALGDRFGRRHVFVAGVAIFTAGSAGCALAPSWNADRRSRSTGCRRLDHHAAVPDAPHRRDAPAPPRSRARRLGGRRRRRRVARASTRRRAHPGAVLALDLLAQFPVERRNPPSTAGRTSIRHHSGTTRRDSKQPIRHPTPSAESNTPAGASHLPHERATAVGSGQRAPSPEQSEHSSRRRCRECCPRRGSGRHRGPAPDSRCGRQARVMPRRVARLRETTPSRPERARRRALPGLPQLLSEQHPRDRAWRPPAFVTSLQAEAQPAPRRPAFVSEQVCALNRQEPCLWRRAGRPRVSRCAPALLSRRVRIRGCRGCRSGPEVAVRTRVAEDDSSLGGPQARTH